MTVTINGSTGIDKVQDGSIVQADLASGVAGNGPAFSAYQDAVQSVSSGVYTKAQFNKEAFDTANCFDSSTNYRFTPNVAGYYQFNASTTLVLNVNNQTAFGLLYKNGNQVLWSSSTGSGTGYPTTSLSTTIYMNGTSDYVEVYMLQNSGASVNSVALATYMQFSGALVRAA